MFISRVEIPWEGVRNPYNMHRRLWRMFPGEERETRSIENAMQHLLEDARRLSQHRPCSAWEYELAGALQPPRLEERNQGVQ